jgi:prevent-host-death family protein
MTIQISIGQVKRDISELVNRVAYQGERIVLTSRGRPKAVLVSLEDYEKLQQGDASQPARAAWLVNARALAEQIRQRRSDQPIDVQALLDEDRKDLEARDGQ